jgi:very-short-patch-repair endonuclease
MASHLEEAFANQWLVSFPNLPFQREHVIPVWKAWAVFQLQEGLKSRKPPPFRADFAWPNAQVAVEINGGIWRPGGHSTGSGITRDITKTTLAQLSGWVLIPLSESHVFDDNPFWLRLIADLVTERRDQLLSREPSSGATGGHRSTTELSLLDTLDGVSRRPGRSRARTQRSRVDLRSTLGQLRQQAAALGAQC